MTDVKWIGICISHSDSADGTWDEPVRSVLRHMILVHVNKYLSIFGNDSLKVIEKENTVLEKCRKGNSFQAENGLYFLAQWLLIFFF